MRHFVFIIVLCFLGSYAKRDTLATGQARRVKKGILTLLGLHHRPNKQISRSPYHATENYISFIYQRLIHNNGSSKIPQIYRDADTITGFVNQPNKLHRRVKKNFPSALYFDFSEVPPYSKVTGAKLRIYKKVYRTNRPNDICNVTFSRIVSNKREVIVHSIEIKNNFSKWIEVDMIKASKIWTKNSQHNDGLSIKVHDSTGKEISTNEYFLGSSPSSGNDVKAPFLVVCFLNEDHRSAGGGSGGARRGGSNNHRRRHNRRGSQRWSQRGSRRSKSRVKRSRDDLVNHSSDDGNKVYDGEDGDDDGVYDGGDDDGEDDDDDDGIDDSEEEDDEDDEDDEDIDDKANLNKEVFEKAITTDNEIDDDVQMGSIRHDPYSVNEFMSRRRSKRSTCEGGQNNRDELMAASKKSCSLKSLKVEFCELGWQDWIIAPKSYEASICLGVCEFPLTQRMNSTNHAIVQVLVNLFYNLKSKRREKVPKPSCAPSQMDSIKVLYFVDTKNVVLKTYKNMIVKSCGCQ